MDDSYDLWLNTTQQLPLVSAGFAGPPGTVVITTGFQPGTNVLRMRVNNAMGPTGFSLVGGLTAVAGRCPS